MNMDLAGKAVLVTGAGTGIGAAVATGFAREGAAVALHFRRSSGDAHAVAEEITKAGGKVVLVEGDLGQAGEARRVVEEAASSLGRLDVLVNNAGSLIRRATFMEFDRDLFKKVMDLNVNAVIEGSQAAVPHIEAQGGGAIINVGSIAGYDGGGSGVGHYAGAKAYVHNLTKHMARDLAGRGIRVNAISPGVIATAFHNQTPADRMEAMRKSIHLGRIGTAEDCVGPVLFLASPSLSGYITGQILHINGGQLMP